MTQVVFDKERYVVENGECEELGLREMRELRTKVSLIGLRHFCEFIYAQRGSTEHCVGEAER
jgi:hypothetical protein